MLRSARPDSCPGTMRGPEADGPFVEIPVGDVVGRDQLRVAFDPAEQHAEQPWAAGASSDVSHPLAPAAAPDQQRVDADAGLEPVDDRSVLDEMHVRDPPDRIASDVDDLGT